MSEKRQPEFIFQANRKNPEKGGKPIHLSVFELFPARLWKNVPKVTENYGPLVPLFGLYRLRIDRQWFSFHPNYLFLTFHEAWRVIGSMTSEAIQVPVNWDHDYHHFVRGDRVRAKGAEGFIKTVVLSSTIDEFGIEWVKVHGHPDFIPANTLSSSENSNRSKGTSYSEAVAKLGKGMALWHWPELPDRKQPLSESWEVITQEQCAQRGIDPKLSTVVALQLGGMSMHEAEDLFRTLLP